MSRSGEEPGTDAVYRDAVRASLDGVSAQDLRRGRRIKWLLHGHDVLPAWVAEMDFPIAPEIHAAIAELVGHNDFGYHRLPIDPRLREAFVSRMQKRFGWHVELRSVYAMVNVVQGLDAGILLYSEPGDGIVVQTPIYAPFLRSVDGNARRRVESPLVAGQQGYEIDFDHLKSVIDARTSVFLLCNPHNPTGRVFAQRELESIAEVVLENDLMVVSDEIHAELTYGDRRHIPFASLSPELARRTMTVTSTTKAFNLAGLPMAVAVMGSAEMKRRFRELPPLLLGHGGILGTEASITAWTRGSAWLEEVVSYLDENRAFLADFAQRRLPNVRFHPPEATYLGWLDCRELGLPEEPWDFFLRRAKVALSDGNEFGAVGKGHVRLNFATSQRILSDILERMASALEQV